MYANLKASDGRYVQLGTPARGVQALVDRLVPGVKLLELNDEGVSRLRAALDEIWLQKTAAEWERFTQEECGVASAPVLTTQEWLADAHALSSNTVVELEDPELGPTRQAGFPVWLSRTQPRLRGARRPLGRDQDEVLAELAGSSWSG